MSAALPDSHPFDTTARAPGEDAVGEDGKPRRGILKKLRALHQRHQVLVDVLRWVLPALVVGGVLRLLLLHYFPYAMWGADSRSFFTFTHKYLATGSISLGHKRRYLYPLLLLPISLLPGGELRWLPLFQHVFGLASLLPLAYVIRKTLVFWRWWIIPITIAYAGLPIVLWCEHELLGDHLFFALLVWTFGGWMAWTTQTDARRARALFWTFLIPFFLFIITKPSGRFILPGILVGLAMVKAWRVLGRREAAGLLMLVAITPTVGWQKQGAWLAYNAVFPLTRLDTPLHAEYKTEIREPVENLRGRLDIYHALDDKETFYFLRDPNAQDSRPHWKPLGENEELKKKIYMDLAIEAIAHRPDLFLYLGLQRLVFACNASDFSTNHFADGHFIERTTPYYAEAEQHEDSPLRIAYGLPAHGPIPSLQSFGQMLEPYPRSWSSRLVQAWVGSYGTKLDLVRVPRAPRTEYRLSVASPTLLGWWLLAAMGLSLLPHYRPTLGVWMITAAGYAYGVFLVSVVSTHYFAPIWPMLLVLLAVPLDAFLAKYREALLPNPLA
jgi:hypothetical protein